MDIEKRELLFAEIGKFFLDIAKLIFGGIILAGIMEIGVDKYLLFMIGGALTVIFAIAGLLLMILSKTPLFRLSAPRVKLKSYPKPLMLMRLSMY